MINLNDIDPQTVTEMALLQYARSLEHKLIDLNHEKGYEPHIHPFVDRMEVSDAVQQRMWNGLARVTVLRKNAGCKLTCISRPDKLNPDKYFEAGIYVDSEFMYNLSHQANAMGDLYKLALEKIAKIYNYKAGRNGF